MRNLLLLFTIVFTVLTFAGCAYVLFHKGQVNAGYAVVSMVLALACLTSYRNRRD